MAELAVVLSSIAGSGAVLSLDGDGVATSALEPVSTITGAPTNLFALPCIDLQSAEPSVLLAWAGVESVFVLVNSFHGVLLNMLRLLVDCRLFSNKGRSS